MILDIGKEKYSASNDEEKMLQKETNKKLLLDFILMEEISKVCWNFYIYKAFCCYTNEKNKKTKKKKRTKKKCSSRCSDMAEKASSLTCWANTRILVISTMNINLIYSYRFLFFDSSIMTTISCTTHQENLYGIWRHQDIPPSKSVHLTGKKDALFSSCNRF